MVYFDKIKRLCKENNITIKELCTRLNYDRTKLVHVEKGTSSFSKADILKIADILGVWPEEITDDKSLYAHSNSLFNENRVYSSLHVELLAPSEQNPTPELRLLLDDKAIRIKASSIVFSTKDKKGGIETALSFKIAMKDAPSDADSSADKYIIP